MGSRAGRLTRRTTHEHRRDRTGHHRPDPRTLDDPAQLGALDRPLPEPRVPLSRGCLPRPGGRDGGLACADPSPIAALTVPDTVAHLECVNAGVDHPPIIIGHSFGGALTQLLLARGHGAAGVVIDSAPVEGVRVSPPSQIRSLFPFLNNPANRHWAVGFTRPSSVVGRPRDSQWALDGRGGLSFVHPGWAAGPVNDQVGLPSREQHRFHLIVRRQTISGGVAATTSCRSSAPDSDTVSVRCPFRPHLIIVVMPRRVDQVPPIRTP